MTPEAKTQTALASVANLPGQPLRGVREPRKSARQLAAWESGSAVQWPLAGACRAHTAASDLPFRSAWSSMRRPMLPGPSFAVPGDHLSRSVAFAGSGVVATGLCALAVRARTRIGRQERAGDEIGQQAAGAQRFGGFGIVPVAGRACRKRPLLEHPSREKRQGRLFHHLVEQYGQLPPEIRHVFQFRDFEIAKGSVGTFAEIVHRRSPEPSRHKLSPVGVGLNTVWAKSRKGNIDRLLCKPSFACGNGDPLRPGLEQFTAGGVVFR